MEQLLQSYGTSILCATKDHAGQAGQAGKVLANQANQASKLIADRVAEKVKEKHSGPKYFYMMPGGVPKGPASRDDIRVLLTQGMIQEDALLAEVGTQDWRALEALSAEWDQHPPH
jgi:hypothetical protein